MIDPREFIKNSNDSSKNKLQDIDGSFACPENGCYEVSTSGKYDENERKIFWTCSNGHEGVAII